jgi:hypothetical protein
VVVAEGGRVEESDSEVVAVVRDKGGKADAEHRKKGKKR